MQRWVEELGPRASEDWLKEVMTELNLKVGEKKCSLGRGDSMSKSHVAEWSGFVWRRTIRPCDWSAESKGTHGTL